MAQTAEELKAETNRQKPVRSAESWRRRAAVCGLILLVAAVLRLIWPNDIEFKRDERLIFAHSQQPLSQSFREPGIETSVGFSSPPLTYSLFSLLASISGAHSPVDLARTVELANLAALAVLLVFALIEVQSSEKEIWMWAAALASVNPYFFLLQRKIWNPGLAPIFTVPMIFCWWRRSTVLGALGLGALLMLLGQLDQAGFFLAAGLLLWSILLDRRSINFIGLALGGLVGAVPMISWLNYMARLNPTKLTGHRNLLHLLEFRFWILWIRQPLGLGLAFNLGSESFKDFLRYPVLVGHQTWLVGLLHLGVFAVAAFLLVAAIRYTRSFSWRELFSGTRSQTAFLHAAGFFGFGSLMTLSALPVHRHYLAMAFPLQFLWIPLIALGTSESSLQRRSGRTVLLALYLLELGISFAMLAYIHQHGAPLGDFGVPLSQQIR